MRDVRPLEIELTIGYTDKAGKTHKRVTFGKLVTGKQLFAIDSDPQSEIPTQYEALIKRAAITEFGTLKMPVPLAALLALDLIDHDDLTEGFNKFSEINGGDSPPEMLDENRLKLSVGYESNGLVYDQVEFGRRLIVMHEVEADRSKLRGIARMCFLAGKQVARLSQSGDGASVLEGPIGIDVFEQLVASDINAIRVAAEVYRQSFRLPGAAVSTNGGSAKRAGTGDADRVD